MVTADVDEPPEVVVKNGVWPEVPVELVDKVKVTEEPVFVTGLP
jgi:hypothetical protein